MNKTNAVLRRYGKSAVGTPYDRHNSAVRSPTTPCERLGITVRSQYERRGCVWRLYSVPTAFSAMVLRCYRAPMALRRRGHGMLCNSTRTSATLRSCNCDHCALTAFSPRFSCASTAFSAMLLRCYRDSMALPWGVM